MNRGRGRAARRSEPSASPRSPPVRLQLKSIHDLRLEVERLEAEIIAKKSEYEQLGETKSNAATSGRSSSCVSEGGADGVAADFTLQQRNSFLRNEIKQLQALERRYATDPRVTKKRNELQVVKMQISEVEKEIGTLQVVQKRRDRGLRAIGQTEEEGRRMRGRQNEENAQMRDKVRELSDKLREVEKEAMDAHVKYAKLQEQLKLSLTSEDLHRLHKDVKRQEREIKDLVSQEHMWHRRRNSVREEGHSVITKQQKECEKLEREAARLQDVLAQKDAELRRSTQTSALFRSMGELT